MAELQKVFKGNKNNLYKHSDVKQHPTNYQGLNCRQLALTSKNIICNSELNRRQTSTAIVAVGEPKIKAEKSSELKTYRRRTVYPDLLEQLKGSYTVERTEKVQRTNGHTSQLYIQRHSTIFHLFEEFDHRKKNSNMERDGKVLTKENEEEKESHEKMQYGSTPEDTAAYLDRGNGSCTETGSVEKLATQRGIVCSMTIEGKGKHSDDQHQRWHHRNTFLPNKSPERNEETYYDRRSLIQGPRNADKYNNKMKPSYSYIALIAMAILSSPSNELLLADIYSYIEERFSYFRHQDQSWRNSIRHNLSLNDCFVKTKRSGNGKGSYWTIHPDNLQDFARGDYRQRKPRQRVRNRSACTASYRHGSCYVPHEFVTYPTMHTPPWLLMVDRCKDVTNCPWSTSHTPVHSISGLPGYHSSYPAPLPWQSVMSAGTNPLSEITKMEWGTKKLHYYSPRSFGDAAYQDTLMEGITPGAPSWQETLEKLQQQLTKKSLNDES